MNEYWSAQNMSALGFYLRKSILGLNFHSFTRFFNWIFHSPPSHETNSRTLQVTFISAQIPIWQIRMQYIFFIWHFIILVFREKRIKLTNHTYHNFKYLFQLDYIGSPRSPSGNGSMGPRGKVGIPNFVSGPREYIMEGEYVILAMCSWFRIR